MKIRIVLVFLLSLLPFAVVAQERDSVFPDYSAYAGFVDSRVMSREFIELIQVLGGRDEYTPEQLTGIQNRFLAIYPSDFTNRAVTRETMLGGGFRQEMRIYWSDNSGYVYFYALLHQRANDLVVLNFTLNSDVTEVLNEF